MNAKEYEEFLTQKNFTKTQEQTEIFTLSDEWKNPETGITLIFLHALGTRPAQLTQLISLTDVEKDYTVKSANSVWAWEDIQGEAATRDIQLSEAQCKKLLEKNAKGISEYGFDGISNVLDDIQVCDFCNGGMNILDNADEDGSYEIEYDFTICAKCKEKGDYVSCSSCEIYYKRENTNPDPNDPEQVICQDCKE